MQPHMKPKLGNAAMLFADGPSSNTPNFQTGLLSHKWSVPIIVATCACIVLGMFLLNKTPAPTPLSAATEYAQEGQTHEAIPVVQTDKEGEQIIGALIHNTREDDGLYAANHSKKSKALTEAERQQLLKIISN